MNETSNKVIDAINNSPYKAYFAISGGGQTFIGYYMSRSGASKTVIGANVPYSQYAFDKFVKWPVDSYASEKAARQLAVAAYNECIAAGVPSKYAVGLGCACSLAKDDERKGRIHKVHVAVHKRDSTSAFNGEYDQGATRIQEEYCVAKLLLHTLNRMTVDVRGTQTPMFDRFNFRIANGAVYSELLENTPHIMMSKNFDDEANPLIIYPGSWNPLHDGHKQIAAIAQRALGAPVVFELSINNVDKGQIDALEIQDRTEAITKAGHAVAISNAPTFVEKASRFRSQFGGSDIIFVVGYDTWNRIWDEKYAGPKEKVAAAFEANRVKFLVFDCGNMTVGYGSHLRIQPTQEVYGFRCDIRGTNLRKQNGN